MSPSTNTCSVSTASKETLAIFPNNSLTSLSLSKYDLGNIHNDIKAMTDKHHSDIEDLNEHIYAMIEIITDASSKIDKKEQQLRDISFKPSTYENLLEKLNITETQTQPLSLQITDIASKFSAYENHLDKLSIANITKF